MKRKILVQVYDALFEAFGPQHWWPGETPFEVIVGAVLTQNTNWANVERAIANLKAANLLEPRRLAACRPDRLAILIRPSGYYNVKARRLRALLCWLLERTGDGDLDRLRGIPTRALRTDLLGIPGIGPETADSILLYALHRRTFVVDAYTRRFLARHGLIQPDASYDEIKLLFESALPASVRMYNEYHALIVRLGKQLCCARPLCARCPLRATLGEPIVRT